MFAALAEQLSACYTVATYDRRGFSRSLLDRAQDYAHRVATDADDARWLIEELTDKLATVLGTSSRLRRRATHRARRKRRTNPPMINGTRSALPPPRARPSD